MHTRFGDIGNPCVQNCSDTLNGFETALPHVLVSCALSNPICMAHVLYMNHQIDQTLTGRAASTARPMRADLKGSTTFLVLPGPNPKPAW
jgi:hypothetical protein